jgi:CheY-like chemotaxis protein
VPAPSVIVVEDDAIIALRNYELLTRSGYVVPEMFASGEELLAYLDKGGPPDLILMDIGLAGKIDGIETALKVRERHDVPVIFLSSYSDDIRLARAHGIPPNIYLFKPVVDQHLLEVVGTTLGPASPEMPGDLQILR